jgi:hypothetical protein
MNTVEKISQHTRNLPGMYQTEVLDFVEYLENKIRMKTGDESMIEEQEQFENHEEEDIQLSSLGMQTDFWQSLSLEELAILQGVRPMSDINLIANTWPGTGDDGFEEDIQTLRKTQKKESRS